MLVLRSRSPRFSELSDFKRRLRCTLALAIVLTTGNSFGQDLPDLLALAAPDEAPSTLFSTSLGDSDVSLKISGSWKGSAKSGIGLQLTPLGASLALREAPLTFMQETDLTLSLWVRERWFVEASFLDDYALNTYRLGYRGKEDENLQYLGIGNKGLDFPDFPYLNLGGDAPNSFGFYGRYGAGSLVFHTLLRYDAAAGEEKIFSGDRERTTTDIPLDRMARARVFVLPDRELDSTPILYLEDPAGPLAGSDGRRWRRAESKEYAGSAFHGIIELLPSPKGLVAVSYEKDGQAFPWVSSLGEYGSPTGGRGFLGSAQVWFDQSGSILRLWDYPQPGQENTSLIRTLGNKPATLSIGGKPALVLYEQGTFSPFERMNRYRSPQEQAASSAEVVSLGTGESAAGFECIPADQAKGEKAAYDVIPIDDSADPRSVEYRWPLVRRMPEAYLPGLKPSRADITLRLTTYGPAGAYSIGTDVVGGSVKVFREGMPDALARFDTETGMVTLSSPAGLTETIRIRYLKRADERRFGSLAGGIGTVYKGPGPWSASAAMGFRWNVSGSAFTEGSASNPGTIGAGGNLRWDREQVKANLNLGFAYEQVDTTGLFRIAGMEGSEYGLAFPAAGIIPSPAPSLLQPELKVAERGFLLYRDYNSTDILGNRILKPIEWDGSRIRPDFQGPYFVRDEALSTAVLVSDFTLTHATPWTGFQFPLDTESGSLGAAKELRIPFRFYKTEHTAAFQIWVQIGTLSGSDSAERENPTLSVAKLVFDSREGSPSESWSIKTISLSDSDRRSLQNARSLRFIVRFLNAPVSGDTIEGRFLIAPPIAAGAGFRPILRKGGIISEAPDNGTLGVAALEAVDPSLRSAYPAQIDRLHPGALPQRVLKLAWNGLQQNQAPGADSRVPGVPLGQYGKLSFFIRGPEAKNPSEQARLDSARFHVVLAQGPGETGTERSVLDISIPFSALAKNYWSKVDVVYQGDERYAAIGSTRIPDARIDYRGTVDPGGTNRTGYLVFLIEEGTGPIPEGSLSVDEITLENPIPYYRGNAGSWIGWTQKDPILWKGTIPILRDAQAETVFESALSGNPFDASRGPRSADAGAASRSSFGATILGAQVKLDLGLSAGRLGAQWNAGHESEIPLGPVHIKEQFSVRPGEDSYDHRASIGVAGIVDGKATAGAKSARNSVSRDWTADLGSTAGKTLLGWALGVRAGIQSKPGAKAEHQNYYDYWRASAAFMLPDGGADAAKRKMGIGADLELRTEPIGLRVSADADSAHSANPRTSSSEASMRLDLPYRFFSFKGSLWGERSFGRSLPEVRADFFSDVQGFDEYLRDSGELWGILPYYGLFDPHVAGLMEKAIIHGASGKRANLSAYKESYGFAMELPLAQGISALFRPVSLRTNIERMLDQKLDAVQDKLSMGAGADFTATNLFGAFGSTPLFSSYKSDEISHRLEASVIVPQGQAAEWKAQAEQGISLYGFIDSRLDANHGLSLSSRGWTDSFTLAWSAPAPKSLLGLVYDAAMGRMENKRSWPMLSEMASAAAERMRKESVEILIEQEDKNSVTLSLAHESSVRIVGRFALSSTVGINAMRDNLTERTTILASLGLSLKINY